jgi:hypothetical protein
LNTGSGVITGNGSGLSAIAGGNVTGQVANSLVAGTVYTAAKTNITSVGTLTSLAVTGNTTVGNLIGPHANGNSNVNIPAANGNINLTAVGNTTLVITGTGANITGTANITGNVFDAVGKLRAIPQSGSAKTSSYTLATSDVGEFIQIGTGGSIVVPDATFSTGDVVSIFNNTTGNITMTMSITTAYIGGTDADKATITLATRGVATVLFISGTVCVVNGNVS